MSGYIASLVFLAWMIFANCITLRMKIMNVGPESVRRPLTLLYCEFQILTSGYQIYKQREISSLSWRSNNYSVFFKPKWVSIQLSFGWDIWAFPTRDFKYHVVKQPLLLKSKPVSTRLSFEMPNLMWIWCDLHSHHFF